MKNILARVIYYTAFSLLFINCKNHKPDHAVLTEKVRYKNDLKNLIEVFRNDTVVESHKVESIPKFMLLFFNNISTEEFNIANPGEVWDGTDAKQGRVIDSGKTQKDSGINSIKLPNKKLVVFGIGNQTAYISFLEGGFISKTSFYILKFKGERIEDYWFGNSNIPIESTSQAILFMKGDN